MPEVKVKLRSREYPVIIGYRILDKLPGLIEGIKPSQVFAVYDRTVQSLHGEVARRALDQTGVPVREIDVAPGERSKSAATLGRLHDFLLQRKVSRDDLVLAIGGGVTSDLAGYAAATVLRGIRWGVLSTTLLGMVDAAIGGKTGINHRTGKNLIGAFWQPEFVLCDTCFLKSLSVRQRLGGWGEVAKYAGLVGGKLLERVAAHQPDSPGEDSPELLRVIRDCAAYKAHIVAADERESGRRMLLNFGHTLGHGIEKAVGYGHLLHGEAVLLGLEAACELSVLSGHGKESDLGEYRELLRPLLERVPRVQVSTGAVMKAIGIDKKRAGQSLRFVLLVAPGQPLIADKVSEAQARKALESTMRLHRQLKG